MLPDGLLSGEAAPLRCAVGAAGAGRGRMRAAASSSQKWNIMMELAIWRDGKCAKTGLMIAHTGCNCAQPRAGMELPASGADVRNRGGSWHPPVATLSGATATAPAQTAAALPSRAWQARPTEGMLDCETGRCWYRARSAGEKLSSALLTHKLPLLQGLPHALAVHALQAAPRRRVQAAHRCRAQLLSQLQASQRVVVAQNRLAALTFLSVMDAHTECSRPIKRGFGVGRRAAQAAGAC